MNPVEIYDSTLRDGTQGEGVSFSLEDKLAIAARLDEMAFDFVEGGYPLSNEKDIAFFESAARRTWRHAKLCAFGMTRRANTRAEDDDGLAALLAANTPVVTVVGKSWDIHVTDVLRTGLDENLAMIADSIRHLRSKGREVFFDAEHFFDGFKANPEYAMKTLAAASESGAARLVLCDTNGGSLPGEVREIVARVVDETGAAIGFHGHNDGEVAVANTLTAVAAGAIHVQGTVNGLGERAGNANLCSVIPNLVLKMGHECAVGANLQRLTELSRYVYEVGNIMLPDTQPFVGRSVFAHKGGMHVNAVLKNPVTYEHIRPEEVGNERRILISELSGSSTILAKLEKSDMPRDKATMRRILQEVQRLENEGYAFEAAEGSFSLLVRRLVGAYQPFFELEGFRVIVEKRRGTGIESITEATVKLRVGGQEELSASEGDGPVNALDGALRGALDRFYPALRAVRLVDYKVRVINPRAGTAAKVRVMVEWRDDDEVWGTVGVSENVIQASWEALVDSMEYKLFKEVEAENGGTRE